MTPAKEKDQTSWTTADVIDLEYFTHRDTDAEEKDLRQRDRTLFVRHIEPVLKKSPPAAGIPNRTVMRLWLEHRRRENQEAPETGNVFPGAAFGQGYGLMRVILILAGILIGFGSATVFLRYTGTEPINVSIYLGGLLIPQMLLMTVLIMTVCFPSLFRPEGTPSPVYGVLGAILSKTIQRMTGIISKNITPEKQGGIMSATELIRGGHRHHKKLFFLPVFILAQFFAVCVNAGILAATLVRVTGTDLAFGWQSTLALSPGFVHRTVGLIAAPWAWMVPQDWATPSLAQIEGSRIILKEGIRQLTTPDLIAWWPFLCFCILVYGFLPRACLLVTGIILRKKNLSKLDFSDAKSDAVLTRMTAPVISSGRRTKGTVDNDHPSDTPPENGGFKTSITSFLKHDAGCMALIPEDLFDHCDTVRLLHHFPHRFSFKGIETVKITLDEKEDELPVKSFFRQHADGTPPNIFLLLEAWRPPIKEIMDYIRWLRKMTGKHLLIYIGLVGKPQNDTVFTPARDADYTVWKQKITALRDPYLQHERMASHDE
jgi:hypothetical protein